jgi:hypothetical protein
MCHNISVYDMMSYIPYYFLSPGFKKALLPCKPTYVSGEGREKKERLKFFFIRLWFEIKYPKNPMDCKVFLSLFA